jgi:hypothetical protein
LSKKISALTALTAPADGDLLPIVDVSDTTDAASGTTKKIAVSSFFPTSSTDNAIARFDGITGKLLQNSGIEISDIQGGSNYIAINPTTKAGAGTPLTISSGVSSDGAPGILYLAGGSAVAGNNAGADNYLMGGSGYGSGAGGRPIVQGGQGGATGAGGVAIVQGGAGGATSGNGGAAAIVGGSATNGNSSGGSVTISPGAKNGSGANGLIALYPYYNASYYANIDVSNIASSNKTFTFPNVSGNLAVEIGRAHV